MIVVSPLDAPVLLVFGAVAAFAHRRWLSQRNEDWFVVLGAMAVGIFWLSLLIDGVTDLASLNIAPTIQTESAILAVFYPLAYPFWFWLGGWIIFLLFGRRPEQGGVYWLYRLRDRTEDFDPAWES